MALVLAACGSTSTAGPPESSAAVTTTLATPSTVASTPATSSPATSGVAPSPVPRPTGAPTTTLVPPEPTTCSSAEWRFTVPAGWLANVQPAGSTHASCTLVAPALVARRLTMTDGILRLADDLILEGGPWLALGQARPSVEAFLREFVRNSGSDAEPIITATAVRLTTPAPNIEIRRIVVGTDPPEIVRLRIRFVLAESTGYWLAGSTTEVLLVGMPETGTILTALNSDDLLGTPGPGITMADAASALDEIAGSLRR